MSQYFIENPDVMTRERELGVEVFGCRFKFLTNSGLFSCDKVDEASLYLLNNMPPVKGALLDFGCGYGVIGIVLAKLQDINLTQSDVNSLALEYAKRNARLNGVHTNAVHSDCFDKITESFDHIVLNPPIHAGKEVMYRMYTEAAEHLNPGGSFFIVIKKKHGAESTLDKLNALFPAVNILSKRKGCYVIECRQAQYD